MKSHVVAPAFACALAVLLWGTPLAAQGVEANAALSAAPSDGASTDADPSVAEAQSLFAQGVALAGEERWGDAIAYFRRSRALVERPGTVFNIAVALVRLGRATEALEALGDFLRIANAPADAERRAEAERMQVLVRATVAQLEVTLSPADARLVLDGAERAEQGRSRTVALDPGRHTLLVSASDHAERRLEVSVLPGETTRVTVQLSPTTGRLVIAATPLDVRLHVDGSSVDTTRGLDGSLAVSLAPGRHLVRLEADDREPSERSVVLRAGARTTLHVDLPPKRTTLLESPIFWIVTGVVAASAGVAIGLAATDTTPPYGGSTGIVLGN